MKKRWISLVTAIILVVLCLTVSALAEEDGIPQATTKISHVYYQNDPVGLKNENLEIKSWFPYKDELLLGDARVFSGDLAKASIALASTAYSQEHVTVAMERMGYQVYDNSAAYDRVASLTLEDNDAVAYTIGYRDVMYNDELYRIYCVPVKGTSGNAEWYSNFNLGSGPDHKGFRIAAETVYQDLTYRMAGDDIPSDHRVIWVMGHSRGAAVANLIAGWLVKHADALPSRVFGYTFACPAVSKNADPTMRNIYNFNDPSDLIPMLPSEAWGYKRNGISISNWSGDMNGTGDSAEDALYLNDVALQFERLSNETQDLFLGSTWKSLIHSIVPAQSYFNSEKPLFMFAAFMLDKQSNTTFWDLVQYLGKDLPKNVGSKLADVVSGKVFKNKLATLQSDYDKQCEIAERLLAETADMTEVEAEEYLSRYSSDVEKLSQAADMTIITIADLHTAKEIVYRASTGLLDLWDIYQSGDGFLFDGDGNIMTSLKHGHTTLTYLTWINALYSGYMGWYGNTELTSLEIPGCVTSIDEYTFSGCSNLKEVTIAEGVAQIGDRAFFECSSLTEATIAESVTSIGRDAFTNCVSMTRLTMPGTAEIEIDSGTNSSFKNCPNIQEVMLTGHGPMHSSLGNDGFIPGIRPWSQNAAVTVTIEEGLTSICTYAFYNCPGLVRITIPESVTTIGFRAFLGCTGLTEVTIPGSVTTIGEYSFQDCTGLTEVPIPESVTSIGRGAFSNCSNLTEVTIPESVTSIGGGAFAGCTGMTKVTMPGTAEITANMGGEASFSNCPNIQEVILTGHGPMHESMGLNGPGDPGEERPWSQNAAVTVTIREGLTSIAERAFSDCPGLLQITIPESVEIIEEGAFRNCVGLTKVTMPGTAQIVASAYYGENTSFYHCPSIQEVILTGHGEMYDNFYSGEGPADRPWEQNSEVTVTIRDGLTSISRYAFSECPGIVRVTIPESVTSVGEYAFSGCTGLTELTIPEGVTGIGESAFKSCIGLKTLSIPVSVTSIGEEAFNYCWYLKDVYYGGSREQWNAITIEEGNEPILNPEIATIHYAVGFDITTQPVDYVGKLNSTATFSVSAEGESLSYQWQISDDGENWTNSSVKRAVYTTKLTAARDGRQVRCVVTDANGTKVTSAVATMKLSGPVITTQPKDYTGKLNSTATFTVAAEGNGLAYQWQLSDDNGATWTNSSVKRAAYTSKLTADKDGRQVRCIVTNAEGGKVTSEVATMKLAGPDITTQPKDYTGKLNSTASFSVAATGDGLTYQWQISDDNGATWTNSSVKKAVYTTKLTAERDGRMVRCIVTDANGKQATSAAATMRLAGPVITSQPKNYVGKVNSTASFTVVAEGNGLSYQWQISDNDGDSWTNSSVKKAVYTSKLTTAKDGRMVRCVVTDADGNSVTSNDVTMRIG